MTTNELEFLKSINVEKLRVLDLYQYDIDNNRPAGLRGYEPLCYDLFTSEPDSEPTVELTCAGINCLDCPLYSKAATMAFLGSQENL